MTPRAPPRQRRRGSKGEQHLEIPSHGAAPDGTAKTKEDIVTMKIRNVALVLAAATLSLAGCNSGGRSGNNTQIPGVSNAAAPLPTDNFSYIGPPLETNRYFHTATSLDNGQVVVIGGTDENSFTSLDTVEVFNQSLFDNPPPESISGDFIDTNFIGDPITMINGGRIYHTSTLLDDGTVLVAGGAFDILTSEAIATAEIFDPQLREFNPNGIEPGNEMITPRFRHTANTLPNGKVLIAGGQRSVAETIIDPNFPPGSPFFQFTITVFPTVKSFEVYNASSRTFEPAQDITGDISEFQTPRGRGDHVAVTVAGFDEVLGTSDDVVLFSSGYQTLSGVFAPDLKFPGFQGQANQSSLEFYDQTTGFNSTAPGLNMLQRMNGGAAENVGEFRNHTLDGVLGVANVALFIGGDNSGANCAFSNVQSEVIVCTFSGFGPAAGIQFFEENAPMAVNSLESVVADPMNCTVIGRTYSDTEMAVTVRTYDGVQHVTNWAVTGGGIGVVPTPTGCYQSLIGAGLPCQAEVVRGFEYYDPFWDPLDRGDLDGDGVIEEFLVNLDLPPEDIPPPWSQSRNRTPLNPTGITGTWLQSDSLVPDNQEDSGYGDELLLTGLLRRERMGHTLNKVPGEDGVLHTPDDRLLVVGGGVEFYGTWGGEPVSVGSEIYLQVNANGAHP